MFSRTQQQLGQQPDGGQAGPSAPSAAGIPAPDETPAPVRRWRTDRRFVTLAGGMALGLFAQIGLVISIP